MGFKEYRNSTKQKTKPQTRRSTTSKLPTYKTQTYKLQNARNQNTTSNMQTYKYTETQETKKPRTPKSERQHTITNHKYKTDIVKFLTHFDIIPHVLEYANIIKQKQRQYIQFQIQ